MSTSSDPSNFLPTANNPSANPNLLKLRGITARPELNGLFGQALSFSEGRYTVALIDGEAAVAAIGLSGGGGGGRPPKQPTCVRLKPENLTKASQIDQLRFMGGALFGAGRKYLGEKEWGRRITSMLPPSLQSRVTPERALMGVAMLMLAFIGVLWYSISRVIGGTKLFSLVMIVALLLVVSSKDWMEGMKQGKSYKLILKSTVSNFPMRWKKQLIGMTGYQGISDRMAMGALVLLLVFSGKALLTSSPSSRPMSMQMGDGDADLSTSYGMMPQRRMHTPPPKYDLEEVYKMGYDDGKAGKEFGTSLPDDILTYTTVAQEQRGDDHQYDDIPNYDWAYNPPPPQPKSQSSLGMGTLLSMFALFRFGKDLVTSPDGQIVFDLNYIMMRVRNIESWRLGLMMMSFYRVVSALISFFR